MMDTYTVSEESKEVVLEKEREATRLVEIPSVNKIFIALREGLFSKYIGI